MLRQVYNCQINPSGDINDEGFSELSEELGIIYINPEFGDQTLSDDHIFGGFIPIRTAHLISGTDIGLMHLNLPVHVDTGEFIPLPASRLTLSLPQDNDEVLAFGYDQGSWSRESDGIQELKHNFKVTQGHVSKVYPDKRDNAMMPFPCFETTATIRSGMSGGPVISKSGFVVGIITSSFDFDDESPPVSYALLLAPAMFINLRSTNENGSEKQCFLWDFADGGAIFVDRGEAVIERSSDQLSIRLGNVHFKSKLGITD